MDDSVRGLSSSSSPSANPRSSHNEADENDQMLLKNQNPKGLPVKHFMAPTISATSKVAVLRKKILTDRNESSDSSETHYQNTSNCVPKASLVHLHGSLDQEFSRKIASQIRVNESDHDEHNSQFSDSSPKPYDPVTNYLSPRPKYVRYNPNRRREMFLQTETEIEKKNKGSDGRSSSVSSSLESSDAIENEEIDILHEEDDHGIEADNEDIEDFENEGSLSLKGIFKFSLVSVVLLLLTWYISCMNSSESSPTLHLIKGLTDGYINGYNHTYDITDVNSNWEDFVKSIDEKRKGINEFFDLDEESGIENDCCDQSKGIEIPDSAEKPEPFQDDQTPTTPDLVSNYVFANGCCHESETELEGVDHVKGIEISESEDKSESFEEYQTALMSDLVDSYVSENEAKGKSVSLDSKVETERENETIEGISVVGDGKVEENDMVDRTEVGSSIEFSSTEHSKANLIYRAFIGIFLIIAPLTLVLHLRGKQTPIEKSQLIDPLFPNMEEAHIEKFKSDANSFMYFPTVKENSKDFPNNEKACIESVKSYANPSMHFPMVEENSKDFPLTRAPTVELLGEFVVGEVRSSMKSCSMEKTKAIEVKTKGMEFQAETKSTSVDKAVNRSVHLSTPELSASTNMLSPSYGSSTAAKKKEDGSAKSTPVRRSSRIRNRAMSP